jgi:hypothetical protein
VLSVQTPDRVDYTEFQLEPTENSQNRLGVAHFEPIHAALRRATIAACDYTKPPGVVRAKGLVATGGSDEETVLALRRDAHRPDDIGVPAARIMAIRTYLGTQLGPFPNRGNRSVP